MVRKLIRSSIRFLRHFNLCRVSTLKIDSESDVFATGKLGGILERHPYFTIISLYGLRPHDFKRVTLFGPLRLIGNHPVRECATCQPCFKWRHPDQHHTIQYRLPPMLRKKLRVFCKHGLRVAATFFECHLDCSSKNRNYSVLLLTCGSRLILPWDDPHGIKDCEPGISLLDGNSVHQAILLRKQNLLDVVSR